MTGRPHPPAGRNGVTDDPDLDAPAPPAMDRSPLEVRYRRWLRLLPKPYRAAREQEMVDTFLQREYGEDPDNADLTAKFGSVGVAETASVIGLALRLRWADPLGPERYRTRSAALRIALFAFLAMAAVTAVISLAGQLWFALWPPADLISLPRVVAIGPPPADLWFVVTRWGFALWIPALVLAVRGGTRAMWWAVALAAVPSAVTVFSAATQPVASANWIATAAIDVAVVAGLAVVAASRSSLTIPRHRGWLITATGAGLGLVALQGAAMNGVSRGWLVPRRLAAIGWIVVDDVGWWCLATAVVGAVLVVRRSRGTPVETESLLGLAYFAGAATLMRGASAADFYPLFSWDITLMPAGVMIGLLVQFVVTAMITVTAGVLAAQRIRRLPPPAYGPTGPPITA